MKIPLHDIDFLKRIPKSDLHVHLDGSLRIHTLIALARSSGVCLPSYEDTGLCELVYKESYNNLEEYLHGFSYACAVLRDPEAIQQVAYELAVDSQADGVRYLEVRFAPQLLMHENLSFEAVMNACWRGLDRAAREFNRRPPVAGGREPAFHYGMIVSVMRYFSKAFSPYYDHLFRGLPYSSAKHIHALAAMELVKAAVRMRSNCAIPIVACDLAGKESGFPAHRYTPAFQYAHSHFLRKTVHAGEAWGPDSIFQAITDLHADRIGHGFYLYDASRLHEPQSPTSRQQFVSDLAEYIAGNRITMEVCPTSNLQTIPELQGDIQRHPLKRMLAEKLSVSICTDNRLVSHTTVSQELQKVIQAFDIPVEHLKNIVAYGFKRSFFPGTYKANRAYVRQVLTYFEEIVKELT